MSFVYLDLTNDGVYRYSIDNEVMAGHQSVIVGLRELDTTETSSLCSIGCGSVSEPPRSDRPFHFTADYRLRTYVSGCYFLDADNHWRSDGLLVSFVCCVPSHPHFIRRHPS